ncbi:cyclin-D1-binding protein 1 [Candoia aspera]|uniref:cyclin-D1-binding protein 1 n=1 Tax=Candoia aspera TaxID=51853 RepID=UPI002FD7F11D
MHPQPARSLGRTRGGGQETRAEKTRTRGAPGGPCTGEPPVSSRGAPFRERPSGRPPPARGPEAPPPGLSQRSDFLAPSGGAGESYVPGCRELLAMEALREALREALAGLRGGGGGGGEDFDRGRFWEALAQAFQAASREATQLSLAAARAPACEQLSKEVCNAVIGATSVYYQLPKSQGKTLNDAVRCATIQVVEGMIQLIEVILRTPRESLSQEQLISTGGIWEACDRVSCLPHDNQAAVALATSSCLELVKDALEEMEQMQAEGGGSPGDLLEDGELGFLENRNLSWSDAERQLLGPCKGLVKATKAGLRKVLGAIRTHGKVDTEEQVAQLDALADAVAELSPSVDELVLSLCPPVNQLTLRLNAGKLASVLMKMLEIARTSHICPPSEESWVQFLGGAVDHNMDKIKGFTQGLLGDPGPAGEDRSAGEVLGGAWANGQP